MQIYCVGKMMHNNIISLLLSVEHQLQVAPVDILRQTMLAQMLQWRHQELIVIVGQPWRIRMSRMSNGEREVMQMPWKLFPVIPL